MFATLDFRFRSACVEVLLVGCVLLITGCGPSIVISIDEAEDGELQSIDRSTLHPLTGCYSYVGKTPSCTNCAPPFFPFPVGLNDEPPGDFAYLGKEERRTNKDESLEANSICLRANGENSIRAVVYRQGKPIAEKIYEGKLRSDGYYMLDPYTQANIFWIPIFWRLTRGQPAFAILPDGQLKAVEDQSGSIFITILPFFGVDSSETRYFQKVSDPRAPSKSNQSGS